MDKKEALKQINAGKDEEDNNYFSLADADKKLKADKEVVLEAVKKESSALDYADDKLKTDKDVILMAVNGGNLKVANDVMRKDKKIVLAAVKSDGRALEYADDSFKKDKEIVLETVKISGGALEYADDSLKKDKEIVLEAVKDYISPFEHADDSLKQDIMRANGSIQGIDNIPDDIKELYKTVWELSMKDIIDMSRKRGYFIDQSQSLNLFLEGATMAKLTSMHFYAWKSGLKTGMYYLRTKSAVDAIKFTLDNKKKSEPAVEAVDVNETLVSQQKQLAVKTAEKFAKQTSTEVEVEPMSADEMKALVAQAKEAEGDDCLMCGS